MKIVVTVPIQEKHRVQLMQAADDAEMIFEPDKEKAADFLDGAEVLIGNLPPYVLKEKGNTLRWVQLNSAGTDGYCEPGILPQGCVLTNATGGYGLAISEYMIAYMFALQKKLPNYWGQKTQHAWKHQGAVRAIYGSTVVCWGMGNIGSEFAQRCKALGCTVIGIKRHPTEKPDFVDELVGPADAACVLPRADVVAMSMPNTAETQHILNAETLALLKDSAIVINVGRGNAIDQTALCEALHNGKIAGAAIDVTDPEPLPENHPMWDAPNLILTPHVSGGWSLAETLDRVIEICAENLKAYRNAEVLRNRINIKTGYKEI